MLTLPRLLSNDHSRHDNNLICYSLFFWHIHICLFRPESDLFGWVFARLYLDLLTNRWTINTIFRLLKPANTTQQNQLILRNKNQLILRNKIYSVNLIMMFGAMYLFSVSCRNVFKQNGMCCLYCSYKCVSLT